MIGTLGSISSKPSSISAQHLPDWLEHGVESSLRDTAMEDPASGPMFAAPVALSSQQAKASAASTPIVLTPRGSSPLPSKNGSAPSTKGAWMDLDKFYEDTEEVVVDGEESDDDDEDEASGEDEDEEEEEEEEEAVVNEGHRKDGTHPEESGDEDDSSEDESDRHSERGLLNPP